MRKIMIMTAVLAGFVAASHAAITAINIGPKGDFWDGGDYEIVTGTSDQGGFNQDVDTASPYRGQTVTTSNAFDLGAISIVYLNNSGAIVTNMAVHVYSIDSPTNSSYTTPLTDPLLFSGTFDAPPTGGSEVLYLLLGTNISLSADSYYAILLDASASGVTNADNISFEWQRSSTAGDIYAGGEGIKNGGAPEVSRDQLLGLGLTPPPTANDDEYILEAQIISGTIAAPGVLLNDLNYDSAVLVDDISSGSLTFNADGSFSFSGLSAGSNTFTYAAVKGTATSTPATVTLFATLSEDPPIVVDDTYVLDLAWDLTNITANVLNNDTNNSILYALSALLVDDVANGTLNVSTNGDFDYTPNPGFEGIDSFTYKAYTPLATSVVANVTLTVQNIGPPGELIESFNTYDNSTDTDLRDIPAAAANWDPFGSGLVDILDADAGQYLQYGYSSGYRGTRSQPGFFSGIPDSSTEYWLYWEMYVTSPSVDGNFGVTANAATSISTSDRGDYTAGVRMSGDGAGNIDLYAFTGDGTSSNDVLLTTGLDQDAWYGIWLNINNAANTYDVYLGEAGDASNLGTLIGSDIAFDATEADLVALIGSSQRDTRIDNIIHVDPDNFVSNLPANLYGNSIASFDTMQLSIGLNDRANAADYWPVSLDSLTSTNWVHVAHSDAADGTFAVTNLTVASGDETNKVIYVKTSDSVEFFRINNQ